MHYNLDLSLAPSLPFDLGLTRLWCELLVGGLAFGTLLAARYAPGREPGGVIDELLGYWFWLNDSVGVPEDFPLGQSTAGEDTGRIRKERRKTIGETVHSISDSISERLRGRGNVSQAAYFKWLKAAAPWGRSEEFWDDAVNDPLELHHFLIGRSRDLADELLSLRKQNPGSKVNAVQGAGS